MRQIRNFNDNWYFAKKDEVLKELSEDWEQVNLPHTWNAIDGQDGSNDYFRGTCCYVKKFTKPELLNGQRAFLEFEGVAMSAKVYINGEIITEHKGGYSTFRVDMTEYLQDINLICVLVDNGANDYIYPQKADFTFYGGIYRDVNLLIVSAEHFELEEAGALGIKVTPEINGVNATVKVETWQNTDASVVVTIFDKEGKEVITGNAKSIDCDSGYKAELSLNIEDVHLWEGTQSPYLYNAVAKLVINDIAVDSISSRFGCRTLTFDAQNGFFLNGKPYALRGVSRHQDRAGVGSALSKEMHKEDMEIIKEIGANTVRLAHYQHAQYFYDLCDEEGMIVWAEIPYITQHMPKGRENTLSQMKELVTQCYNHPSIVCWGLSNEITASGSVTEDMMENHRLLNDLCHELDQTRPTTMAHVFMLETDSPLIDIPDISSYNLYFGWYLGELEQNNSFFNEFHKNYPNRVIGFSEYGADANPQYQSAKPERGDYTETYQCLYHEHLLKCIEERPYLWATHVWNLFDFAADGRDEGGKHGINQKGLVTIDRKVYKDAFYLYKAHWSKVPFVHICGRRYMDRTEAVTEVKVYSNQSEVSLYLDGNLLKTKADKHTFVFDVPITGEHELCAKTGKCADKIIIRKADKENPDYRMLQKEEIVNWFDKNAIDPTCFSIKDTMGAIMAHPVGGAILGKIMAKARASRGDVAEATEGNANLQKMMAGLTLESVLKQAGKAVSTEDIQALNEALQKVKK